MGRRGPAPTPTALRLLAGNPGKRPINRDEPKPQPERPPCPRWLHPEAKREWRRIVPELERLGLLTMLDRAALVGYCQSWARYVEAEEAMTKFGSIFKKGEYVQQLPHVAIARNNLLVVKAFATEFGLTPGSRTRISVELPEGKSDPFEEWRNRGSSS